MRRPHPLALLLLLVVAAAAGPLDPSLGLCTRREEFQKRLEAMDGKVLELRAAADEGKRKRLVSALASAAEREIECLIRYREPHLAPVFAEVLRSSKKWFTRARAAYGLKMCGAPEAEAALVSALGDADPRVREAAAGALGHVAAEAGTKALEARAAVEKDPCVLETLRSAAAVAAGGRDYDAGGWSEALEGAEGARRVAYAWVAKGSHAFNRYDARSGDTPTAGKFFYPVQRYKEDLFAGYPRNSFGAGGTHAGEDCAWFREGCSVYAIADGIVRMVQGAGGDWGFLVAIEHRLADGRYVTSVYGHCAFDLLVRAGDRVKGGQRIATQGLSCAIENGGYGSHLHFGLGDGPFRRPAGMAVGDLVNLDLGGGKTAKATVLRLLYASGGKNALGWPLTAFQVRAPDGAERTVDVPEQPLAKEVGWFQAYVKDCRGWLDPQKLLPEWVEGK